MRTGNPLHTTAAYTSAIAVGAKKYDIKETDIGATPQLNVPVNKENTGVCDVVVDGAQMCGLVFAD